MLHDGDRHWKIARQIAEDFSQRGRSAGRRADDDERLPELPRCMRVSLRRVRDGRAAVTPHRMDARYRFNAELELFSDARERARADAARFAHDVERAAAQRFERELRI